jgi:hypothetical protein
MTRKGKIARLPRAIRDELNRRLDNGEQGVRLLEWLNGLPEVAELLNQDFEGRPISKCNLTEWKNGGFVDWRTQQDILALTHEFTANGSQFGEASAEMLQAVETVTMAHYAATLQCTDNSRKENPKARLERLSKSIVDVTRMRRSEHRRKQMEIDRGWLELERKEQELRHQIASESATQPESKEVRPPMSEEEKKALLMEILLAKGELPEGKV